LGELGSDIQVARNDAITIGEIERLDPTHIVISPGPGTPDDAGISLSLVQHFHRTTPILGICLGHQVIGQAFGAKVVNAPRLMHGKVSPVDHDGKGLFSGVQSPFTGMRYHSLIVAEPLPDELAISARTPEGELMALRHVAYPTIGLQFHPESILTENGHKLLHNFLSIERNAGDDGISFLGSHLESPRESDLTIKEAIYKVLAGQDLSEAESEAVMVQIMNGNATPAQIGAYLTAMRMKGETVNEIAGSARAMRRSAVPVHPLRKDTLVDTCGTGGDGVGTFNISTTAAFVVAGTGQPVAKHGNRSISSRSGSADVLQALGVNLELSPRAVANAIDDIGIGFLFAPKLHPAMKHAIGPRRELGVRTLFNVLGPLTNPAGAQCQLLGVYDPILTEPLAHVLRNLGSQGALVVHGHGGLDELTTTGPNRLSVLKSGEVHTETLDPSELGFQAAALKDLAGGDAFENARITRGILEGQVTGAKRDTVVLNAAAALVAADKAETISDGIELCNESIDSRSALRALDALIEYSQSNADR
jgi:anthranilate synthase/phosphoribosyltransferase